ncbi:hypothetical protein HYQ46_006587 [Verticillium longisporum]|nr:hypothetical protein HYQ46_006587 [Verticillium longisporum]
MEELQVAVVLRGLVLGEDVVLLRRAWDMACINSKLLPETRSPVKTARSVCFSAAASFNLSIICTVSFLTSMCGLRNRPQFCVVLKASRARSWSMSLSGMLMMRPRFSLLTMAAASATGKPPWKDRRPRLS